MLKERRLAANQVAEKLFAAELAIDAAIAAVANLTAMMPAARQEARLAACVGQEALSKAMETCMQLVGARASIVATHEALHDTQHQIGLGAVSFLDPWDKPKLTPQARHLATVAA
jgi:hypothetical protein